ncbi:O-sialoglycoprotein endopeptidase [Zhaonella formicivorans]|uniref:Kae1-like domain-containing protein n=1 Tax=Zhaonella formicivorans TaxID=2528593 RepID=UPI0010EB9A96|nr:O-sialoglycoprotein endopeptidase [Zhaonella formicivorans]
MCKFLGIDTSCYTTSLAVVDAGGKLITEHRQLLKVPLGAKGLQQSSAVFQHVQNLPLLLEKVAGEVNFAQLSGVVTSSRPRPVEGSYMPVFTVGSGFGRAIAASLKIPFLITSHQEGHLMAGLWSAKANIPPRFLAVHLSGGTSELLLVEMAKKGGVVFKAELLGGTTDLHAGQLVDRVGVALGLPFPAGPHLQNLAMGAQGKLSIPAAVRKYCFSFSGAETRAKDYINRGEEPAEIARAVEKCIAKTLEKVLRLAVDQYSCHDILLVGGVACNSFLRARLKERLEHRAVGARLHFAESRYSSDNAVGTALLGPLLAT